MIFNEALGSRLLKAAIACALSICMVPATAFASDENLIDADDASSNDSSSAVLPDESKGSDDENISAGEPVDLPEDEDEALEGTADADPEDPGIIDAAPVETEDAIQLEELAASDDPVAAFVTRLYHCVLDRSPDAGGLKTHIDALNSGMSAADIAWGFFGSPEFNRRSLSNDQKIDIAYLAMFDRNPDRGGKANFKTKLDLGMSMRAVISDFSNSAEYRSLCARWSVTPGVLVVIEARDHSQAVTAFVQRLYQKVMGRSADVGGLNVQCGYLLSGGDAANLAWSFFSSAEFGGKGLNAAQQVDIAYMAMLDRASDASGKKDWTSKLESGMSMRAVIAGFCESPEFRQLCSKWGIIPGVLYVVESRDKNQNITAFVQRLYQKSLNRTADTGGLNTHTGYLLSGGNAASLVWSFFSSPEFNNRNLSNADKVESVYLAMLDRPSDAAGKADWTSKLDNGSSLNAVINGFARSEEFRALCKKYGIRAVSFSGDDALDQILENIVSRYGTDLYTLYNYVASYPYYSGSKYPSGDWTPGFAKEMYWNGGGNCYRYAALFEWLAKYVGYDAQAIAGHALNRQGGWNAHGWVEVYINGTTYICDPQSTHAIAGRNFYMVTYGNAPLTYRPW